MQPDRDRVGPERLDVRLWQLNRPLVQIRTACLLDSRDNVRCSHRTEQLAGVPGCLHRQRHRAEALDRGLEFTGMLEALHALDLAGPTNLLGLALGATRCDDREPTRQQEVAAVAVLDLHDVAGHTQVVDLCSENQLHNSSPPYRVDELNGSSATSRAFLTAIAMSRWCCTQFPVTRRARILPRSLM